jgi:hypothetical protein
MEGLTFAQLDQLAAERAAKKRECSERLERILLREFNAAELAFVWTVDGPDLSMVRQAIQNARAKAR